MSLPPARSQKTHLLYQEATHEGAQGTVSLDRVSRRPGKLVRQSVSPRRLSSAATPDEIASSDHLKLI